MDSLFQRWTWNLLWSELSQRLYCSFIQEEPIKTRDVAHHTMCLFFSPAFCFARSPSPTLCDTGVHLAHYTPFTTSPITQRYSWSTLPNFLLCCLPGSLFILLTIFLSFMLAPSQRARKIVPWEKDNNNLWQCTWVKCPRVMKQLQALTDGPCCKLGAAAVTETANRQMRRHNHIHKLSHSCSYSSTRGCQVKH